MESLNFSASETKLLLSVMQHNQGGVQPDWDKVAEQCGYNAPGTARAAWNRVYRTKLSKDGAVKEENGNGGVDKSPGKKSPTKPKKVDGGDKGSPKKGGRKAKKDDKDAAVKEVVAVKVEEVLEGSGEADGVDGE